MAFSFWATSSNFFREDLFMLTANFKKKQKQKQRNTLSICRMYFPFKKNYISHFTDFRLRSPAHPARRTIMLLPALRVLWLHRHSYLTCQQARSSPCLCCCWWPWLLARAGRGSTTTSMHGRTRSSSAPRSPPDTARCGLCRRKCRSRRFPSSWPAPASESLTPKRLPPARAAPSYRTRTDGETRSLGRCWGFTSVPFPPWHFRVFFFLPSPLHLSVVFTSAATMNTCLAVLKGRGRTKAGEPAPRSWQRCRC